MPIEPDPSRRNWRILRDAHGQELGRFVAATRDGLPLADLFTLAPAVAAERAAPVILAELRRHQVSGDTALGRALVAGGARAGRHAHVMSRDLRADPAPADWQDPPAPPGLRLGPIDRPAADLTPAAEAAYPPDHVDNAHLDLPIDHGRELEGLLAGRAVGPLLPVSGLATDRDGAVVAAVLVNDDDDQPPYGGPWVTQVFRGPAAAAPAVPCSSARWAAPPPTGSRRSDWRSRTGTRRSASTRSWGSAGCSRRSPPTCPDRRRNDPACPRTRFEWARTPIEQRKPRCCGAPVPVMDHH